MRFGTSLRVGRGTYIHAGGAGAIGIVLIFAYIGLLLRVAILAISTFVVVATPIALYLATRSSGKRRDERLRQLVRRSIKPSSVVVDGRYTNPRTWGVYRVDRFVGGVRCPYFHFGNHPIRQRELEHEFGEVELLWLFDARIDAEEVESLLTEKRRIAQGKQCRSQPS